MASENQDFRIAVRSTGARPRRNFARPGKTSVERSRKVGSVLEVPWSLCRTQSRGRKIVEFGIPLAATADSWKVVKQAEELGFTHAWFYDSQLLCADCFVAMAAAAVNTTRIRLGTGVLIPSNRIAPVSANAFASLNRLAPGRIDFGIGTGFTGRRTMGLRPVRLADMEEHIRVVMAMLRGETVELAIEGKQRKVTFLDPSLGLINIADPVRLYVAAYGPRAMTTTAKLKAGWISFMVDFELALASMAKMHDTWIKANNVGLDLSAAVFALGCVLAPGEPADSPRAMAQAGPLPAILLHWAADDVLAGRPNPYSTQPEAVRYGTTAKLGVKRQWRLAGTSRWLDGIFVHTQNRTLRCKPRTGPEAVGPRRVVSTAFADFCSSAGSPGNWPSLR
jgi:5,10-methylenetetrahydromethanopterin reductase